mmetsp:Transcript_49025/g.79572  ORF Transcript_49025/g.79572 Transcript_49025/m.79572 type:complete len:217 (-) Transcript_49025:357-1007(-)
MQSLSDLAVHRHVQDRREDADVGWQVQLEIRQFGQGVLLKVFLELRWPNLHELLDVWHPPSILHSGSRLRPVEVVDALDPVVDFLRVLFRILDGSNLHGLQVLVLAQRAQLQVQNGGVGRIQSWFVQLSHTQTRLLVVWSRHLQERVDLSNAGDELWNEGLQRSVKLDRVRLIPRDAIEELLYFGGDLHALEVIRIIRTSRQGSLALFGIPSAPVF